jgi:hypothetical protein
MRVKAIIFDEYNYDYYSSPLTKKYFRRLLILMRKQEEIL